MRGVAIHVHTVQACNGHCHQLSYLTANLRYASRVSVEVLSLLQVDLAALASYSVATATQHEKRAL